MSRQNTSRCTIAMLAAGLLTAQLSAPTGVVQGQVVDSRGQPVNGAIVVLATPPSGELRTRSRHDGSYSFSISPGTDYEVRASHEGLASLSRPFRISNAGEKVG